MKTVLLKTIFLIFLLSCSDDSISFDQDSRVKTIYGIEVILQNGIKDEVIGDLDRNPCQENEFELIAFPNPYFATGTFIQYNLDEEKEVEVSIETAKVTSDLKSQLYEKGYEVKTHTKYTNYVFYTEIKDEGLNSVLHLMYIFEPGPYLIKITDKKGNSSCFPYIIVPNTETP